MDGGRQLIFCEAAACREERAERLRETAGVERARIAAGSVVDACDANGQRIAEDERMVDELVSGATLRDAGSCRARFVFLQGRRRGGDERVYRGARLFTSPASQAS